MCICFAVIVTLYELVVWAADGVTVFDESSDCLKNY